MSGGEKTPTHFYTTALTRVELHVCMWTARTRERLAVLIFRLVATQKYLSWLLTSIKIIIINLQRRFIARFYCPPILQTTTPSFLSPQVPPPDPLGPRAQRRRLRSFLPLFPGACRGRESSGGCRQWEAPGGPVNQKRSGGDSGGWFPRSAADEARA